MRRLVMGVVRTLFVLGVVMVAFAACADAGLGGDLPGPGGTTPIASGEWARTVVATFGSVFNAVAHDAAGNAYAVGYQVGSSTYDFGAGVTATGGAGSGARAVIVKYSPAGTPLWARTVSTAPAASRFYGVTVAGDGSVYAVGYQTGTNAHTYESTDGPGVSATGSSTSDNSVIVKYDGSGQVLWAQSVAGGSTRKSTFQSVSVAGNGSVYAAGWQEGTDAYSYDGQVAQGTATGSNANSVLVKYNSSGAAQWARTVYAGALDSEFRGVAVDGDGAVIAAGMIRGDGAYWFTATDDVTVTGPAFVNHVVVVKYSSAGTAEWARTVASATDFSEFYGVATDADGNIYAAGLRDGGLVHGFGNGVEAAGGLSDFTGVLVKYNSAGATQWARSPLGDNVTQFLAVALDGDSSPHVAGVQNGTASVPYGDGVSASAATAIVNAAVVKYNAAGVAQWARTTTAGAENSLFQGISILPSGALFAVGYQAGSQLYGYGPGVTATSSSSSNNVVIVRFEP